MRSLYALESPSLLDPALVIFVVAIVAIPLSFLWIFRLLQKPAPDNPEGMGPWRMYVIALVGALLIMAVWLLIPGFDPTGATTWQIVTCSVTGVIAASALMWRAKYMCFGILLVATGAGTGASIAFLFYAWPRDSQGLSPVGALIVYACIWGAIFVIGFFLIHLRSIAVDKNEAR